MAKKEAPQSLFRRLTRLFRSGPVIKKKIRTVDTTMAVADKTKSSGTLLFQKSLAPTYATITANAYNLSERLMRYQDFQEMEYSLAIDTQIATPDGYVTIGELAEKCKADPNYTFIVYSYDHNKKQIVPALGKQARQTCVDHAWKITFDSGKSITASPEHRLMLRDGTYRKTEDIQVGDAMMPFYRKDLFEAAEEGTRGYSWIYTMNDKFRGWTKEHQLIAEWISGRSLTEDECVHHINFVKSDNRPENLKIMTNSDHNSYHAAINNGVKWAPENYEWIEQFKKNHATWMRDNAPTQRHDVTFARILETAERVGFSMNAIVSALDIDATLLYQRLSAHGFNGFREFAAAYANGQVETLVAHDKPGLLTRDISIEMIRACATKTDTKQSLCIKLGCTVNVFDKFLARRLRKPWSELRIELGLSDDKKDRFTRVRGRPKCSNGNDLTFQQICDAYEPGLTLPRLKEKLGVNKNTIISRLAQNGYQKYSEFSSQYENHKVVSIEYVGEIPLYDLTVDGYKNFATDSVISHNTPEIAAALDIYADETVAADEKGRCLHIYSDNEKVKEILEDLFYNTLNTEFNLRSWARNLVKYGDFFLYNDVSQHYGVVSAFPIPVNEIEREENYDRDDPFAVRYRWVTLGNRVLENWEVTHFRLLGNDMFLPYGSSVIEPARRIWRQLILIEDAMLVYRVVRAPERRVFYIDVANIPAADIPVYMEEQRKNLRSNQVVDRSTGRVDLRYNPLPVHKDTPVPLLDGSTLSIETLSNKMKEDPHWIPWVYSVQDGTQKVVPGKVVWCDKNYTANKLIKVWLDNESYITTAPEHPFVMRDGSSKRADELIAGDSLMSAYRDITTKGYERIVEPNGDRNSTHVIVARDIYKDKWNSTEYRVVHHKHFEVGPSNKRNNAPENLEVMNFWEHRKLHTDHCSLTLNRPEQLAERRIRRIAYNKSTEKRIKTTELNKKRNSVAAMASYNGSELHASHNEIRRDAQNKSWASNKKQRSEGMQWMIPNEVISFVFDEIKKDSKVGREELSEKIRTCSNIIESLKTANSDKKRDVSKFHVNAVISKLNRMGVINNTDFRSFRKYASEYAPPVNHQVLRIEHINDANDDVYCMTVVGNNGEDDRHNFAVNGISGTEKDIKSLVFVWNSVDEDYFVPVRGTDSGTKIDTLAGGQNTAAVEDVAYIQKKLFAALKIPRAYLGYDEMLGCFTGDTRVPLLNGVMTMEDLAALDWSKKQDVWTYSADPKTGSFRPGRIVKAWVTKHVDELYEVKTDDGGSVRCTGNHLFLCRDGSYKRADELQSGQSLMPLYKKLSIGHKNGGSDRLDGYEMILDNSDGNYYYTHKLVNDAIRDGKHDVSHQRVIHHVDFDKRNNVPSNLQEMTWHDHRKLHSQHLDKTLFRPDVIEKRKKILREGWLISEKHRKLKSKQLTTQHSDKNGALQRWVHGDEIRKVVSTQMKSNWERPDYREIKTSQNKENWNNPDYRSKYEGDAHWSRVAKAKYDINWLRDFCVKNNVTSVQQWRSDYQRSISNISPVGIRYVKNLIVRSGYAGWREFKQTVQYNHKVLSVTVVKLAAPVPVYDLEVEKWHNFSVETLKGDDDSNGSKFILVHNSKATLAQEDIRFSRTISVIQKVMIAELNKLAIIHLYAHGFDQDDLQNFTLRLSNPSTIAQQQKLELWRTKFEIGGSAPEGYVNKDFVRKEIWGLNDEECKQIDKARLKDKIVDGTIESASAPEDDMGDVGGDDDLFGGGGGGDLGGDETEAPADDLPPEENAGEEPEEEVEPGTELLTSADRNDDDDEHFGLKLSDKEMEVPLKAQRQLDRVLYNRGRHRTHGASKTHMPDFQKMTSNDNHAMEDPYDNDWIKSVVSNPFGESRTNYKTNITSDVMSMLNNWTKSKGGSGAQGNQLNNVLLSEDASSKINSNIDDDEDVLIIDDDGADDE